MDDIYNLKSLAPPIPRRAAGRTARPSICQQSKGAGWNLQGKENLELGSQLINKTRRENLFGTVALDRRPKEAIPEKRDITFQEGKHALSTQSEKQGGHLWKCWDRKHHAFANDNMLNTEYTAVIYQQSDTDYEKLNKVTMELDSSQITECTGVHNCADQCYPLTPSLDSENVQFMNTICQRMAAMAIHQFDFWIKQRHLVTSLVASTERNDLLCNHHNSRFANNCPSSIDGQLQGKDAMKYPGCYQEQCGERGCDISKKVGSEILPNAGDCKGHDSGSFGTDTFHHSLQSQQDITGADMNISRGAKNSDRSCLLPDAVANLNDGSDGYLFPGINPINSASQYQAPKLSVDSFGLPLTVFERDSKHADE